MSETAHCDYCMDSGMGGQSITRREARGTEETWTSVRTMQSYTLCADCYRRAIKTADLALGPNAQRPPGAPIATHQRTLDFSRCDQCSTLLKNESYVLELLPSERVLRRKDVYHRVGQLRHVRVCAGCFSWGRSVVYDTTGAHGGAIRSARVDLESWATEHLSDSFSAFLQTEDGVTLSRVLERAGRQNIKLRPWETRGAASGGERPFFVGAGSGLAARFVSSLPREARRWVVVVSRFDTVPDVVGAMQAGAGDFLTSPLSQEQVIGAFDRLLGLSHDELASSHAAGLRPLRRSSIHGDGPAQLFTVEAPSASDDAETLWLVRRFLRGTDAIGRGTDGKTQAYVYCPDAHADDVARRINFILGDHGCIAHEGAASGLGHGTATSGQVPPWEPVAGDLRETA